MACAAADLQRQLQEWLEHASVKEGLRARAIIAPHAGYRYSGNVMAYAYRHMQPESVSRVFLLGPSHHFYTQLCLLSSVSAYQTPFGPLEIDLPVYEALQATGLFKQMPLRVDEAEHSLEMHLPYIAYMMRNKPFKLVPIMVGATTTESEYEYGRVLARYLQDAQNFFVISSDFCHWGSRFNYTFYDPAQGSIHDSITWLDSRGIDAIIKSDAEGFQEYMQQYSNTICGRHPIAVLLQMVRQGGLKFDIELEKYDQSSRCVRPTDSSVSYAAIVLSAHS